MDHKSIVSELAMLKMFFASQQEAGQDISGLLAAQIPSLVAKVNQLKALDPEGATALTNEIKAGLWTQEQVLELATAVANRLSGGSGSKGPGSQLKLQQVEMQHFLAQSDWDFLDDSSNPPAAKARLVAFRAQRLGVRHASEASLARMAAIVAVAGEKKPHASIQELHKNLKDVKMYMQQPSGFECPFSYIVNYPAQPSDLPKAVHDFAYAKTTGPGPCPCADLIAAVSLQKFKRLSSTALRPQTSTTTLALPQAGNAMQGNPMAVMFAQMMSGMQAAYNQQMGTGTPGSSSGINLTFLDPRKTESQDDSQPADNSAGSLSDSERKELQLFRSRSKTLGAGSADVLGLDSSGSVALASAGSQVAAPPVEDEKVDPLAEMDEQMQKAAGLLAEEKKQLKAQGLTSGKRALLTYITLLMPRNQIF